jgi:hypothetical protein
MNHLASANRDRLVNALRTAPNSAAACWPCLPEEHAASLSMRVIGGWTDKALDAYAAALPVTRDRHARILAMLIQRAKRDDLAALTRLAVTSRMDSAWATIVRLLRTALNHSDQVVAVAPWDDLHADVQRTILSSTNRDDVCAAIAFARCVCDQPTPITRETARAFFAAVTREVWNTLPAETHRAWRDALHMLDDSLAVRSLELDPMFMGNAPFNDDMITAIRRDALDDLTIRWMLLPVAVRDLPPMPFPPSSPRCPCRPIPLRSCTSRDVDGRCRLHCTPGSWRIQRRRRTARR